MLGWSSGLGCGLQIHLRGFESLSQLKKIIKMLKRIKCLKNGHKIKEIGKNLTNNTIIKKCVVCNKIINEKNKV
jgi:hypothetical protein